jgi:1,4-dihydroxy-2-naphthoyl-CoA hydrolase
MSTSEAPRHLLWVETRRVIMADSDSGGVIYYSAPYPWHEHALLAWFDSIGHRITDTLAGGQAFPCVHSEADYLKPLRVDDIVDVRMYTAHIGRSSFGLETEFWHGERAGVVRTTYVWAEGHPRSGVKSAPLPGWLRDILNGSGRQPELPA